jgi:phosphatidylinositol-bisphosphatase
MGNKGGVAIRFELYQTSMCFVNSHFAAHLSQYKKRNQNFRDISKKMIFNEIRPNKQIIDHDMIYWLGKSCFLRLFEYYLGRL